jgi:hypothetical protein
MDTTSFIEIIIVIIVAYFLIKFIVSPLIKVIFGIAIVLIILHLLQRFLGFNIDTFLSQFGINLNLNSWLLNFNWLFGSIDNLIDQIKNFINK